MDPNLYLTVQILSGVIGVATFWFSLRRIPPFRYRDPYFG